jgi:hypothetical protein
VSTGTPEPHLPDHRQCSLSVGAIAVADDAAWVADSTSPLVVRLDAGSGEIHGPIELTGTPGASSETGEMAWGRSALWCKRGDELLRYSPEDGEQTHFEIPGFHLAVGPEGVWTGEMSFKTMPDGGSRGTGGILRSLDEASGEIREFSFPGLSPTLLRQGHGAVWAGMLKIEDAQTTVARIDPESGRVQASVELPGMLQHLWIGDGRVVAVTAELVGAESVTHLIGLDPRDARVLTDVRDAHIFPAAAMHGDEVWTQSSYESGDGTQPAAVTRLDAVTGEPRGEIQLSGLLRSVHAGDDGVWCDQISSATKLGDDGSSSELRLDAIPTPTHLVRPAPSEIDAEGWEKQALDAIAAAIPEHNSRDPHFSRLPRGPSSYDELEFVDCELLGSFPTTQLAIYFRAEEHPGVLFGYRWGLWEPDGSAYGWPDHGLMWLMEDVDKSSAPLLRPDAKPDENGVVWF